MSVLIVVAHPDDEVLGCGGTGARLAAAGLSVRSCILSGHADARSHRPEVGELEADTREAQRLLGFGEPVLGSFPNIQFNTVPHLHLVQFIESAIVETGATAIFTHHPSDLNNDHLHTSTACQAAARLFQRRGDVPPLRALYFMEILTSTDWAMRGQGEFRPDTFVALEASDLDRKLQALAAYRGVMRDPPHPRSREVMEGHAGYRGGQSGTRYAESFQTAFRRMEAADLFPQAR
jgi:LmbE family N-acetylglucosaminyl deacetylase